METGTGLIILGTAVRSTKLIEKILGPTAEYLGDKLKEFTQKRAENVARIFRNAGAKLGERLEAPGRVPPRVLKGILQEGSFCDDAMMAEYFGGVLASSKTENGRDDRGACFIAMLSRLSTYQIRSHYIFFSLFKQLFDGSGLDVNDKGRWEMQVYVRMERYAHAMDMSFDETARITEHVMWGLDREMLIHEWSAGATEVLQSDWAGAESPGVILHPMPLGVELFLWAHGHGQCTIAQFLDPSLVIPADTMVNLPKDAIIARHR